MFIIGLVSMMLPFLSCLKMASATVSVDCLKEPYQQRCVLTVLYFGGCTCTSW